MYVHSIETRGYIRVKKLLPVVLIFAACGGAKTQTIKPENIYYDVEYREGVALYPPADTVYEVRTGDTIHVSWQHSLSIADSLDLEIEYDKTEGWEEIGKGLQDLDPVAVDWSTVLDLEEDKTYKFRIWAWRFLTQAERDTLLAETGIVMRNGGDRLHRVTNFRSGL